MPSISDYLKQYGEAKSISLDLQVTDANGQTFVKKYRLKTEESINAIIAANLISKALDGDSKAIDLVLKQHPETLENETLSIEVRRAKARSIIKALEHENNTTKVLLPRPTAKKHNREW